VKRSWWHIVKHVLFGYHSPSLMMVGQCWCQRKGVKEPDISQEKLYEAMRLAAERAYRGRGE
jgi:hypothetical protein